LLEPLKHGDAVTCPLEVERNGQSGRPSPGNCDIQPFQQPISPPPACPD
jgi:hypothetical protein